jgi:hypothetical protein
MYWFSEPKVLFHIWSLKNKTYFSSKASMLLNYFRRGRCRDVVGGRRLQFSALVWSFMCL